MAKGNYAAKVGWTVGRDDWLDLPASKVHRYWRAMEYGQKYKSADDGLILIGLWGQRAGSNLRPNLLREGQRLDASGEGVGQKWVAFGETHSPVTALKRARFALWYYVTNGQMNQPTAEQLNAVFKHGTSKAGKKSNSAVFAYMMRKTTSASQIPFVRATARKPVPGRGYYKEAAASFNPMAREKALIKEILAPMFAGFTSGRAAMASDSGGTARKGRAHQEVPDAKATMQTQQGISHSGGRHGEGKGIGGGITTITATAALQDFIRGGGGQFPAGQWQAAVIEVNQRMAREFQAHLVQTMMSGPHLRPPTGDLLAATKDARNRYPQ